MSYRNIFEYGYKMLGADKTGPLGDFRFFSRVSLSRAPAPFVCVGDNGIRFSHMYKISLR